MSGKYDNIMKLSHHTSERHARMSMLDRAAQFSPFAALTGYDAAIEETARLTDSEIELTEEENLILDSKLHEAAASQQEVSIVYFRQDGKKAGGAYIEAIGFVKRIDYIKETILMSNGALISVGNIVSINCKS